MASKIQKLNASTQRVLQLAAAIGNQFDVQTLAIVLEKSQQEIVLYLQEAVTESLVLPLGDTDKAIAEWEINNGEENFPDCQFTVPLEYKFSHDRIQQAAYSLIPVQDKQGVHWQIGQLLLQNTPQQLREQKIFEIVNQLNISIEAIAAGTKICAITVDDKRNELAQLNLIAGQKAKASAAYESAWNYLKTGMNYLGAKSWQNQYDLTLSIYVEAAEAAI